VSVPASTQVRLLHLGSGEETRLADSQELSLPEGTYTVSLWRADRLVRKQDVAVPAAGVTEIAPARWQGNSTLESIAGHFPQGGGGVYFSESLGDAVVDPDLGVWLAILGGARILGPLGDYSKIAPLPLADFAPEPPGASPIYVLAGSAATPPEMRVGLSAVGGAPTAWTAALEPSGLPGLREAVLHPDPGQHFVSIQIGRQPTLTLASFASPNRCMLIVLTLDGEGQPRVGQYLLPLGHLTSRLADDVRVRLQQRNQLRDVYVLALLSRAFARRRRLEQEIGTGELQELLYAKWLDPIGASLATYECVRRRQHLGALGEVAWNMTHHFADLPDSWAIARLAGKYTGHPRGVPLFFEGVRAFQGDADWLPFPAHQLDFTGPWTAWRGAVPADG
jgi:hypothetical protein